MGDSTVIVYYNQYEGKKYTITWYTFYTMVNSNQKPVKVPQLYGLPELTVNFLVVK